MQALNEAKSVLFDPVKRERHREQIQPRDGAAAKRIAELRNNPRFRPVTQHVPKVQRPRSPWDRKWRRYLNGIIGILVLGAITVIVYEFLTVRQRSADPIQDIIARYRYSDSSNRDPSINDSGNISDDSAERLKKYGDMYFLIGEYLPATQYYSKYLRQIPGDNGVIRNLSTAYFRRGRYADAVEVLSKQMHGDSNLVVAYYNLGRMFLAVEKPFDARDAFAEAVKIADTMRRAGRAPPVVARNAKSELAKLE